MIGSYSASVSQVAMGIYTHTNIIKVSVASHHGQHISVLPA
jgi:hypothetical protein